MQFSSLFLFILVSVFAYNFGKCRAVDCKLKMANQDKVAYTITVDLSGRGNFTKVQDAVNSIPSGNREWIKISLGPGTYREQVIVPHDKKCIFLQGKSFLSTWIEWDSHGLVANGKVATITIEADNFVAKDISFKNTYNLKQVVDGLPNKQIVVAVAAAIKGDKCSFYSCGFYGVQDTLWDAIGRHYFYNCYIEGAIDFIWGSGQSIYKKCKITVLGDLIGKTSGYITAQGRRSTEDPSGFIFTQGTVNGTGGSPVWLGRPYGDYSRVILDRLVLSAMIKPEGWINEWNHTIENCVLAESNCKGMGSDTSRRVSWEKKLSPEEVQRYTDISFIDAPEGWLSKQPLAL